MKLLKEDAREVELATPLWKGIANISIGVNSFGSTQFRRILLFRFSTITRKKSQG
jgi:hypothetical protein